MEFTLIWKGLGFILSGWAKQVQFIPKSTVSLIESLEVKEAPSYVTRGFHVGGKRIRNDEFFLWMARNKLNLWSSEDQPVYFLKKLGMILADGCHEIQPLFLGPWKEYPYNHPKFKGDEDKPDDPYQLGNEYAGDTNGDGKLTYFEAHPEWYGLHDGKRSTNFEEWEGDNFCTSNTDARKELAKNYVQDIINGSNRKQILPK